MRSHNGLICFAAMRAGNALLQPYRQEIRPWVHSQSQEESGSSHDQATDWKPSKPIQSCVQCPHGSLRGKLFFMSFITVSACFCFVLVQRQWQVEWHRHFMLRVHSAVPLTKPRMAGSFERFMLRWIVECVSRPTPNGDCVRSVNLQSVGHLCVHPYCPALLSAPIFRHSRDHSVVA